MRAFCIALGLLLVGSLPKTLAAEVVVLDASKDNTLFEASSNFPSNGIGAGLFSGLTFIDQELRRGLIAFDVATALPAGATVTAVQLEMNVSRALAGTHSSSLHRLTSDWGEGNSNSTERGGGMGAPADQNDATWEHMFFDTQTWTTPGGDFVATPSATTDISAEGPVVWASTPQMVDDVQRWLDTPASNFGWILITQEGTAGSAKRFDSREHPVAGFRPSLTVTYEGTPVQPTTWSATKALFH
jgi:hypothetical protein